MARAAASGVDLEPIDRFKAGMGAEAIKDLLRNVDVEVLAGEMRERMKTEQARAAEENHRLARELDAMRGRLNAGESAAAELSTLRQERDVIRTRVSEMLEQLEALSL